MKNSKDLVVVEGGRVTTTSLKVAEVFEKRHDDVLKKVKALECSAEFKARNFAGVEYKDAKGEKRPMFRMTKDGFMFLAMGFTGKKAAGLKEAYIGRFNEMEQELARVYREGIEPPKKAVPKRRKAGRVPEWSIEKSDRYINDLRNISSNVTMLCRQGCGPTDAVRLVDWNFQCTYGIELGDNVTAVQDAICCRDTGPDCLDQSKSHIPLKRRKSQAFDSDSHLNISEDGELIL